MDMTGFSRTVVPIYQTTQHQVSVEGNPQSLPQELLILGSNSYIKVFLSTKIALVQILCFSLVQHFFDQDFASKSHDCVTLRIMFYNSMLKCVLFNGYTVGLRCYVNINSLPAAVIPL
jgi:hypothetical protein